MCFRSVDIAIWVAVPLLACAQESLHVAEPDKPVDTVPAISNDRILGVIPNFQTCLLYTSKRRGTGVAEARANAGFIASSIGSASATPAPRRR